MTEEFIENPQIEDVKSPALRDFFNVWRHLDEEFNALRRKDFSPTIFADHLPFIILMDYGPERGRFFVRLFGSGYVEGVGGDMTNQVVSQGPETVDLLARFQWLVDNRRPYLAQGCQLVWSPMDYKTYDTLACPLFDDEGGVSGIIGRIEFQ